MEYIPVTMVRPHLEGLPQVSLPAGYRIRTYRRGEEACWAEVESAVGEFATPAAALAHFQEEFGAFPEAMEQRCFFLEDATGRVIGTATAWRDDGRLPWAASCPEGWRGEGRLHWVAIHPQFQGRGLGKPLVGAAMRRLAEQHARAYLTTQTTSWIAIRIYLDFGFEPLPGTPQYERAWSLIAAASGHPALAAFRRE